MFKTYNKNLTEILVDPEVYTTTLLTYLFSKYGTDWVDWDPITFSQIMKETIGDYPPQHLMDKFGAGSTLLGSNIFFKDVFAFSSICTTLNNGVTVSETFLPADYGDILWGCTEATLLLGDELYTPEEFSSDVKLFVGSTLANQGIHTKPTLLNWATLPDKEETNIRNLLSTDETFSKILYDKEQEYSKGTHATIVGKVAQMFKQLEMLPIDVNNKYIKAMTAKVNKVVEEQI